MTTLQPLGRFHFRRNMLANAHNCVSLDSLNQDSEETLQKYRWLPLFSPLGLQTAHSQAWAWIMIAPNDHVRLLFTFPTRKQHLKYTFSCVGWASVASSSSCCSQSGTKAALSPFHPSLRAMTRTCAICPRPIPVALRNIHSVTMGTVTVANTLSNHVFRALRWTDSWCEQHGRIP